MTNINLNKSSKRISNKINWESLFRNWLDSGSDSDFQRIYPKLKQLGLYTLLQKFGKGLSEFDRDEVLQTTMIKLIDSRIQLKNNLKGASLKTWFYRVLVNNAINLLKKLAVENKRFELTDDFGENATKYESVETSYFIEEEEEDSTLKTLNSIKEYLMEKVEITESNKSYEFFYLKFFKGMKSNEISRMFGVTEGLVSIYVKQVRKEISTLFGVVDAEWF